MNSSKFESLTGTVDRDFPEYEVPPAEPIALARRWIDAAVEQDVREPRAMALATATATGRASNRVIAFIELTDEGVLFTSHRTSQKGNELAETAWASGLLYWRETGQQLILSGPVRRVPEDESDSLWHARPVPLHPMSTASRQSAPLHDAEVLRGQARSLAAIGSALPRPASFVGYRLRPAAVEFWCASSDRMHRRLRYDRQADGWSVVRLQP